MKHSFDTRIRRRQAIAATLAGLFAFDRAGARPLASPDPTPGEKGPLIAVSLRDLNRSLERLAADGLPVPKDLMLLGGMAWIEAVVIQPKDLVLVGRRGDARSASFFHLDDLVVLSKNREERGRWPYCSLDPTPESVLAVRRLESERQAFSSVEDFRAFGERYAAAWNAKGQTVVVGGSAVRPESRVAHAMIDPDYHDLKGVAQGRVVMPGVPSLIERSIVSARAGAALGGGGAARLWIHVADRQPRYREQPDVIALDALDMTVLTERQLSTKDGRLLDANDGRQDPEMAAFAADMSRALALRPGRPPLNDRLARLENNLRLLAILEAIEFKGLVQHSGVDLSFLTRRQPEIETRPMPSSLPGMVTYKAIETVERTATGTARQVQFPLVCGGVDMAMRVADDSFIEDRGGSLQRLTALVAQRRPAERPAYFLLES